MRSMQNMDVHSRAAQYTLDHNGGTFVPHVGRVVDTSSVYVVALGHPFEHMIDVGDCEMFNRRMVKREIEKFTEAHRPQWNEGYWLGTWIHNGILYLDVVEKFHAYDDAYQAAVERGQIAFWDGINQITRRVGSDVVTSQ